MLTNLQSKPCTILQPTSSCGEMQDLPPLHSQGRGLHALVPGIQIVKLTIVWLTNSLINNIISYKALPVFFPFSENWILGLVQVNLGKWRFFMVWCVTTITPIPLSNTQWIYFISVILSFYELPLKNRKKNILKSYIKMEKKNVKSNIS